MINIFKTKNPYNLIVIPIIIIANVILQKNIPQINPQAYELIPKIVSNIIPPNALAVIEFTTIIIIVNAIIFSALYMVNYSNIMQKNNLLYPFVLLFLMILQPEVPSQASASISALFTVLAIWTIIKSPQSENITLSYFNTAILVSIATIINPIYAIFILIIPLALIVFRQPKQRTFIAALIGIATPIWLFHGTYYIITNEIPILENIQTITQNIKIQKTTLNTYERLIVVYMTVLTTIAIIYTLKRKSNIKITHRQTFSLITLTLILTLTAVILQSNQRHKLYPMLAILSSIPIAFFWNNSNNKLLRRITFDMFLILLIFIHLNYHTKIFF